MSHGPLTYDAPQVDLLPDVGERRYGNVDNLVEVAFHLCDPFFVPIAIPTWLFSFMREVANVPRDAEVSLALDQVGERFVFSMLAGDQLYDLWDYSYGSLPPCFRSSL
jgi:hypothetical protein